VDGLHAHGSQTTGRHDDDPSNALATHELSAGEAIGSRYEHPGYTLVAVLEVVGILEAE
jgi:hypothetical protein